MGVSVWPEPRSGFGALFEPPAEANTHGIPDPDMPEYASELWRPHRYKVLWGGRGAARSWSVARALVTLGARAPIRVLCARELQRSIKDSVHRLLQDQIELLGLPGYDVTQAEIRHANGTLFLFYGLRYNATQIKSLEAVDLCWVEEAERVSEESWNVLIPTIRKSGSEIWVTFNPDVESDPTYRRFVLRPPPEAWVRKVSAEDNPWLPEELRKERDWLYQVDPDAAAHVWGGECRSATDAQVLKGKWVVEHFEPDATWPHPYHGLDFGFAQDPTAGVQVYVRERTLYVRRELYRISLEIDDTARALEVAIPGIAGYVVRADSARPDSISYLRRHGMPRIEGVKKGPGSVEDGIAHLRSYERIVVHPDCRHFADECRLYSYKLDARTDDVLPEIVDKHNHLIDATRYALQPLIRARGMPWSL